MPAVAERLRDMLEPGDFVILSGELVVLPALPNGEGCGIAGVVGAAGKLSVAFSSLSLSILTRRVLVR